jgi:hypothetical protein
VLLGAASIASAQPRVVADNGRGCPGIPAGTDIFPSTAKLVLDILIDTGEPFVVRLSSADLPDSVVQRQPQVGDTMDVELVSGQMGGFHPRTGGIEVRIGSDFGLPPTFGQLTNIVQDPASCDLVHADSFFDVFFEINVFGLGETWAPVQPLHLESKLKRLPPEDVKYENPFVNPIQLVDQASGDPRGRVLYHMHHADPPFPPPGPDCFDTFMTLFAQIPPLGFFGPLQAFGPTTVERGPPFSSGSCSGSGDPCVADVDCPPGETCVLSQNTMPTQITEMQLQGFDPFLGGFTVRVQGADSAPPSQGEAVSQVPGHGTYAADSFFDVFVDISLDDQGVLLRNQQPVPMHAGPNGPSIGIRNTPPDPQTPWQSPPGLPIPISLTDGTPVGEISDVIHIIEPPRDWELPPAEDYCFASWVHLEVTIFNPFCQEELWLQGHFRILHDDPTTLPTGQDILDALMAKAEFDGTSLCAGALSVGLNPQETSSGAISSLAPEEMFPADSFFDVYVEMDTGIGTLHTEDPSHMTTTINELPPIDEIYFGPGTIIPLYSEDGTQIGEILEVSHEVHEQIFCPADCRSVIIFPNKNQMFVGIPGGGGGIRYDAVRGDVGVLHFSGTFIGHVLIASNVPPLINVPGPVPLPGGGWYFLARARFGGWADTWSSLGSGEQCCRDASLP